MESKRPIGCHETDLVRLCVRTKKSVVSHVINIRERLAAMTDLVKDNMKEAQVRQKKWYDTKSKMRECSPGQEVLLLLPSNSNVLEAKWQGPFKVNRKVGLVDYEIETNHKGQKLKVYRVNLLKESKRRTMVGELSWNN